MKLKLFAGLLLAGLLVSHAAPVQAAQIEETLESAPILQNMNVEVMFIQDTHAKSDSQLQGHIDRVIKKYTKGTYMTKTAEGLAVVKVDGQMVRVLPSVLTAGKENIARLEAEKKAEAEKAAAEKAAKEKAEKEAKEKEAREKAEREAREKEEKEQEEKRKAAQSEWSGPVLTASAGTVEGPSGKETYYNLPMEGVVSIMRSQGNQDEYWVREDGVKMLGQYVMIAAHLDLRPRGSLVETSLGMGIVCDTGGFAASNPTQIDIATAW
ncbi:MAG: hypothetical protein HUJ54_06575 [Erysipelotrichaceae bacterium]|nr:hypothetical protein [Erysipelotrichaceae bacterium]